MILFLICSSDGVMTCLFLTSFILLDIVRWFYGFLEREIELHTHCILPLADCFVLSAIRPHGCSFWGLGECGLMWTEPTEKYREITENKADLLGSVVHQSLGSLQTVVQISLDSFGGFRPVLFSSINTSTKEIVSGMLTDLWFHLSLLNVSGQTDLNMHQR